MKQTAKAGGDPWISLLEYRNTPLDGTDGYAPSEILNSRLLKSRIPTSVNLLVPHVVPPMQALLQARQEKQKKFHDRRTASKLHPVNVDQPVRFLNPRGDWEFGHIAGKDINPRSYVVETPIGKQYRRNRKHLFPTRERLQHTQLQSDEYDMYEENSEADHQVISQANPQNVTQENPPNVVQENPQNVIQSENGPPVNVRPKTSVVYDTIPTRPTIQTRSGRISKPTTRLDI